MVATCRYTFQVVMLYIDWYSCRGKINHQFKQSIVKISVMGSFNVIKLKMSNINMNIKKYLKIVNLLVFEVHSYERYRDTKVSSF